MRYSRAYSRLLLVPARYRYVYTCAGCIVPLLLWGLMWYVPNEKRLYRYDQEIRQFKKDGDTCIEQQAICKKVTEDIDQLKSDLTGVCNTVSPISSYVAIILHHAQQAGLTVLSIRVVDQKEREQYISERLSLQISGPLSALIHFFSLIFDGQHLMQCDDVSLQRQADGTFLLQGQIRLLLPKSPLKSIESIQTESPSTLKKAEGLGG